MPRSLLPCLLALFTLLTGLGAAPTPAKLLELKRSVRQMVSDPARSRVYATTSANTVLVISTGKPALQAEIPVGSSPVGLDISPDGNTLYVANSGSTATGLTLVDLNTLAVRATFATPAEPSYVVAGLEDRLYILTGQDIYQLSAATGAVQVAFSTAIPETYALIYGGFLRATPDRTTLFYGDSGLSPASLAAFEIGTATPALREENNFSSLGGNGQDLVVSPSGQFLTYLTGSGNGNGYNIALLSTAQLSTRFGSFAADAYPTNGAFSPDNSLFYTAPSSQNVVKVFSTKTFTLEASFPIETNSPGRLLTDSTGTRLFFATEEFFDDAADSLIVFDLNSSTPPLITSAAAGTLRQGKYGQFKLKSNQPGVTWAASALPKGLSLNATTGLISGTPIGASVFPLVVTATSSSGLATRQNVVLDVQTLFTLTTTGDGTVTGVAAPKTWQTVGTLLNLKAVPEPYGSFLTWTGAAKTIAPDLQVRIKPNLVLRAYFTVLTPITLAVQGPGSIDLGTVTLKRAPGSQLALQATAAEGARFIGWNTPVPVTTPSFSYLVPATPVTLTAYFATADQAALRLGRTGPGTIFPSESSILLKAKGSPVTVQAQPQKATRFLGWSGAVATTSAPLSLTLEGDTTLLASFESLAPYAGTYQLRASAADAAGRRAAATLKVSASGAFTGTLLAGGRTYRFKGSFLNPDGFDVTLPIKGAAPAALHLSLPVAEDIHTLQATLSPSGTASIPLAGIRQVMLPTGQTVPQRGAYTLLLPPPSEAFLPGYATLSISSRGTLSLNGRLGDGTPFTTTAALNEAAGAVLDLNLPHRAGLLQGELQLVAADSTFQVNGQATWFQPATKTTPSQRFPQAFSGARLPATGQLLTYSAARFTAQGGALAEPLNTGVAVNGGNRLQPLDPNLLVLKLTLNPRTGLLTGSFRPVDRSITFRGIVDPRSQTAVGQFTRSGQLGSISLQPWE